MASVRVEYRPSAQEGTIHYQSNLCPNIASDEMRLYATCMVIYLASLDASVIDDANAKILKKL